MSAEKDSQNQSPAWIKTLIGGVVATIVGIPVFIILAVKLTTGGMTVDTSSPSMTQEAIAARIQPVGVAKLDESGPPGSRSGKAVYDAVCASCHTAGLAGSPKLGDAGAWSARLSQGFAKLVEHAVKGFNAMPAKGGAADLTDDEVARAVAFMGNAAGGKFTEPAIAGASAPAVAAPQETAAIDPAVKGKEIYNSVCMACHATGAAGAPKFGDKAAWASRLKDGADASVARAIKGINAMPPKGGYSGSDAEFTAAAHYLQQSAK